MENQLFAPEADISLNNLVKNFYTIQSIVGKAKIMAVVKANAYGHGIIHVAQVLEKSDVHGFCVALVSEAEKLLKNKIQKPILHLGRISYDDLEIYSSGQIHCTINSLEDVEFIKDKFKGNRIIVNAHLKIDTGMGRLGISFSESEKIIKLIGKTSEINLKAVYSHLSSSGELDAQYTKLQLDRFNHIKELTEHLLPETKYFHIANSAAILNYSNSHFNMVRPGISLYGVSPLGNTKNNLLPVMKMKGAVVLIKKINKNEYIGYNRTYKAKTNEHIAIIQAGYADGIPIVFSNNGNVEIKGKLYPIIGKVSMDLIAVKSIDNKISVGDEVIFWGSNKESNSLEYISKKYNKIPYEFLTGVSNRVKRNFINE